MHIDNEGRVHFTDTEIEQAKNRLTKFKGCHVRVQIDYGGDEGDENTAYLSGEIESIDQDGRFVIGLDLDFVVEDGVDIQPHVWQG